MGVFTLADAILGSLTLKNVRNTQITDNGQVINGTLSSGALSEYFGGRKDLRATFSSDDVEGVCGVANILTAGLVINPGTITIPFQKRKSFSTFDTGAVNYAAAGTIACVYPTSFQVSDNGNATVNVETIFASSDGLTPPVTESSTHSLGSQAFASLFALGPITINSTDVGCPKSLTINTGINAEPFFCQGHNFAKDVFIRPPITPSIVVEHPALEDFVASMGAWKAGASLTAYLRKRATAGFVADATAEHIKFSFADGIVQSQVSGQSAEDASRSITFMGEALTVATSTAIA